MRNKINTLPPRFKMLVRLLPIVSLACAAGTIAGCTTQKPTAVAAKTVAKVQVTRAKEEFLQKRLILPAEILSYQWVDIYPKVTGFIRWIGVDRGSVVKQGQVLVKLIAPELDAQTRAAEATRLESDSQVKEAAKQVLRAQAQTLKDTAKMRADTRTYDRLLKASETKGAIAQNEVDLARDAAEADRQQVEADKRMIQAAQAQLGAAQDHLRASVEQLHNLQVMQSYLTVTAPYDGIVTQRNMHEGSLAYPPSGAAGYLPMLEVKQLSPLRIVVAVPEEAAAGVELGMPVNFSVSAYPGRTFVGTVARIAHSLAQKTRTMPVELNYPNTKWEISPGMFAQAFWTQRRSYRTLFVPGSSIVVSLKTPFVIRVRDSVAQRVAITQGQTMGDLVEVFGNLSVGDDIVVPGTDTIETGTRVNTAAYAEASASKR